MAKKRLDVMLTEQNLVSSRERAKNNYNGRLSIS